MGGFAIGYGASNADLDARGGDLDGTGWSATLYGTYYATDHFYVEGSATYGWDSYDQTRNIITPVATRSAKTDYDGTRYSFLLGAGYDFLQGPGIIDVYGRLRYIHSDIDGYTETGAGGLNMTIEDQDATSFKSILGVQYSQSFSTAKAVLVPQVWFEWAHEFESGDDNVKGWFTSDPTQALFDLTTDSFDTDSFRFGVGLGAQFAQGRTAFISYEAVTGLRDNTEHSVTAGFRMSY